ncbi:MAG: helix-turn-helix domain-containing protein [Chloroflexota bacterium]|nr:helix-turn-helix domain-containing protein [Chloroflexota bacterium]
MTEWMTVKEACAYLKVDRRTLYKYMKLGKLPYYQLGGVGTRRFRREDLDALLVPMGGKQKTAQTKV